MSPLFASRGPLTCRFPKRALKKGFTLVELLAVIGIVVVVMAISSRFLSPPPTNLSKAAFEIAGLLQQARAQAIALNTYVWVGIAEVDQVQSESAIPQKDGVGRVALLAVQSKDGSRVYNDLDPDWTTSYNQAPVGGRLSVLGKLLRLENIHLVDIGFPASGNMKRAPVSKEFRLGTNDAVSLLRFSYPLSAPIGSGQYTFQKVIQFNSQGAATIIQNAGSVLALANRLELSIQITHGNQILPSPADPNVGQHASIQLDGLTGAVKLYFP